MSDRRDATHRGSATRRLARPATAWVLLAVIVAMFVAFGVVFYSPLTSPALFQATGGLSAAFVFPFCSFTIVGAVIAMRRPANPVGWLCICGAGCPRSRVALCACRLGPLGRAQRLRRLRLLLSAFWNAPGGNVTVLFTHHAARLSQRPSAFAEVALADVCGAGSGTVGARLVCHQSDSRRARHYFESPTGRRRSRRVSWPFPVQHRW